MPDLENSKRNMERATYTTIRAERKVERKPGRAWEKWSFVAALSPTAREVAAATRRMTSGENAVPEGERMFLGVIERSVEARPESPTASLPLKVAPEFAPVPATLLSRFGEELLRIREEEVNATIESLARIVTRHGQAVSGSGARPESATGAIPQGYALDPTTVVGGLPGGRVYRLAGAPERITPKPPKPAAGAARPAVETIGVVSLGGAILVRPPAETTEPATSAPTPVAIGGLLNWAIARDVEKAQAERMLESASLLGADVASMTPVQYRQAAVSSLGNVRDLTHAFVQKMQVEPIGMLHLERLSFVPAGIERGELKYSVPLSPGEEVNISHKEWSNTSEEFEKIVTDSIEAYSEEGVTEKSELMQASDSQQQHNSGFNLGITASGGFGPMSISTSLGYNVSDSESSSRRSSLGQSNELTRRASSRVMKEHKMSFKVSSASGTEDQAVRRIRNPFPDKATRVDYYQLVRKWRVDLYRYGLRMTYDLVVPEPGSDILSKIIELKALNKALQEGFGSPDATLPWARFDLTPEQITRGNYLALAGQYGAAVEPPPDEVVSQVRVFTRAWPDSESASKYEFSTFDIDVPDGYVVIGVAWPFHWNKWDGGTLEIVTDMGSWLLVSGRLTLTIGTKLVSSFEIEVKLEAGLKPSVYDAWRLSTWNALREAAQASYEQNRVLLKDRLAKLQDELGAQDALSLRKAEREEMMKLVLRWLFGPGFTFVPWGLPTDLYGPNESVIGQSVWAKVLAKGEVIKFLHHAIEWENMLFILYPYFWSHTARWELKKYLDHPDFLHRVFLKSGSARVVLTIRPGYEKDFVSFLETGTIDGLPGDHPYMTIAQEMEAFAKTNYPGIRAANPVENARPLLSPLQEKAWKEMQGVIALLEKFKASNSAYPTTGEGLAALAGIGSVPAADPWGNPYRYRSPGVFSDFELWSLGSDGQEGGEGEAADITSWAEASLIGRWYEYTPTAALDVAFDETMPSS